ncbi:hypothetical protein [Oribacterium sinus]|uniref:Immunity protein 30 domain-containing protein n=1 Tax=Oribacterium sinus F0268 TaxID=585501 RepID=C2L018_9FIRM|nr:hypothetical protein [Oribacterium sinus]EEJ50644.1 hypothetical protein HMPREF6123_2087 [Oribacterium sinus F0268]
METLNSIIQKMEAGMQDNDDLETVMMDCMEEMEENYNQLDSVQPLLRLMERHPLTDFGSPGPIAHFVERFYKKGYEEELLLSLKRMPTLHTVWMLHRLINGTDQAEVYLDLLKEISENASCDKEIREEALHFLSIY